MRIYFQVKQNILFHPKQFFFSLSLWAFFTLKKNELNFLMKHCFATKKVKQFILKLSMQCEIIPVCFCFLAETVQAISPRFVNFYSAPTLCFWAQCLFTEKKSPSSTQEFPNLHERFLVQHPTAHSSHTTLFQNMGLSSYHTP